MAYILVAPIKNIIYWNRCPGVIFPSSPISNNLYLRGITPEDMGSKKGVIHTRTVYFQNCKLRDNKLNTRFLAHNVIFDSCSDEFIERNLRVCTFPNINHVFLHNTDSSNLYYFLYRLYFNQKRYNIPPNVYVIGGYTPGYPENIRFLTSIHFHLILDNICKEITHPFAK